MLVRALKVLGYFRNETASTDIDTAALDQPGDEGCAYGRATPDWQRITLNLRPICRDHYSMIRKNWVRLSLAINAQGVGAEIVLFNNPIATTKGDR